MRDLEIAAFVEERLAEDDALIERNSGGRGLDDGFPDYRTYDDSDTKAADEYIDRFSPDRLRREIAAKRRILERHTSSSGFHLCVIREYDAFEQHGWNTTPCPTLLDLAAPYEGHPDFNPAWSVKP